MINGLLGKKIGMTQIFNERGETVPVTVVEAGPCVVTQVRTKENDGYEAVQIGFGDARPRTLSKPEVGHLKNVGRVVRHLREFHADDIATYEVGAVLNADVFTKGERVDVTGTSKGKGFAGVVKRYHFAGGRKTHGQSDRHRHAGSIGNDTTPGRVLKGKRMGGRMGGKRVTVQGLEVVGIDTERHLLLIKGSIPGARNGLVMVRRAVKAKK
jgi:large subunit ribosomal protein L3